MTVRCLTIQNISRSRPAFVASTSWRITLRGLYGYLLVCNTEPSPKPFCEPLKRWIWKQVLRPGNLAYFGNLDLDFCDMALKEDIQPSHAQMNITTRRFQYVPCYNSFFLCSLTFQMTMKGGKLARLLLSVVALEILFFTGSDAVPQVGCSSARPSFPRWVNNWQQSCLMPHQ